MSWARFCKDFNIDVEEKKDNYQIQCPMCGTASHGAYHMALHLKSSSWKCWLGEEHRGKNPARLIMHLLHIDFDAAIEISKQYFGDINYVRDIFGKQDPAAPKPTKMPEEFTPFTGAKEEKPFANYLKKRDLDPVYATQRFNLHYTTVGEFAYRLIIPIIAYGSWFSWTGRSIDPDNRIRYLTASEIDSTPNDWLFDYDNLKGGDILYLKEGPFDAMAVNSLMIPGVQATCLFGKTISTRQTKLLMQLSKLYARITVSLDVSELSSTMKMSQKLCSYFNNCDFMHTTEAKDWAAMDKIILRDHILKHKKGVIHV